MNRKEIILAALAPANGRKHTPVQVQKLLFLIDREIHSLIGGPYFDFKAYHYGPFDPAIYQTLEDLNSDGHVDIVPDQTWKSYVLTPSGQVEGSRLLTNFPDKPRNYIEQVSAFVLSLSFEDLVAAIYKAYPDMQVNSVFRE